MSEQKKVTNLSESLLALRDAVEEDRKRVELRKARGKERAEETALDMINNVFMKLAAKGKTSEVFLCMSVTQCGCGELLQAFQAHGFNAYYSADGESIVVSWE